jgi:hypothetical protein
MRKRDPRNFEPEIRELHRLYSGRVRVPVSDPPASSAGLVSNQSMRLSHDPLICLFLVSRTNWNWLARIHKATVVRIVTRHEFCQHHKQMSITLPCPLASLQPQRVRIDISFQPKSYRDKPTQLRVLSIPIIRSCTRVGA